MPPTLAVSPASTVDPEPPVPPAPLTFARATPVHGAGPLPVAPVRWPPPAAAAAHPVLPVDGIDPWEAGRLWTQEYRAGRLGLQRLADMLHNPDTDVAHAAAIGLIAGAGRAGLELVAAEIRSSHDADRDADLVEAGEAFEDRPAAATLLDELMAERDEDAAGLLEAALAAVAAPSLIDDLRQRLAGAGDEQSERITDTLRQVDDPALADYLLELEGQSRAEGMTEWRGAIYDALAVMGTGPAAARLLSRLGETSGPEADYVGRSVRSLRSADVLPVLREAAGNRSGRIATAVRVAAMEAMAWQTDPAVETWLKAVADAEADPAVAAAARKSLDTWHMARAPAD